MNKDQKGFSVVEALSLFVVLLVVIFAGELIYKHTHKTHVVAKTTTSTVHSTTSQATLAQVPAAISPVNPAALPIGDGKVSTTPKVGYVDDCSTSFPNTGGATADGPWINQTNGTWNSETKLSVEGSVSWPSAYYTNTITGSSRMITTNDLPIDHPTGTFPILRSDPAYSYDHNPNTIKPQPTSWMLAANPTAASSPGCTSGGVIGVLSDGVLLYNALDGEGRDAGAHEILDSYQGHPDMSGTYHHHEVPTYLLGTSANKSSSTLIGYAVDGYGIYVERDSNGNLLTNANLDACHGRTSEVMWNGKMTNIYHYDATLEYPYTIGCFHGTPIDTNQQMKMN